MGILSVDLDKINLDNGNNFDEDDPDFSLGVMTLEKIKHTKKI